jgi:putative endonuclease
MTPQIHSRARMARRSMSSRSSLNRTEPGGWSVYIVRCRDGSLYTGIAIDVARRLAEHRGAGGRGARYPSGRAPLRLVFQQAVGSRSRALRIEHRIKRLTKGKKERLVRDGDLSLIAGAARAGPP